MIICYTIRAPLSFGSRGSDELLLTSSLVRGSADLRIEIELVLELELSVPSTSTSISFQSRPRCRTYEDGLASSIEVEIHLDFVPLNT